MGVEDTSAYSRKAEPFETFGACVPEKNTFIHYQYVADFDVVPPPAPGPLVRAHTEPHERTPSFEGLRALSSASAETLAAPSSSGDESPSHAGCPDEESSQTCPEPAAAQHAHEGWAMEDEQPDSQEPSEVSSDTPAEQHFHEVWCIDGKRLRSKDTRQSRTFSVQLGGDAGETLDFVMLLRAKEMSRRRGQGCFFASNGVGTVEVKCTKDLSYPVAISIVVGEGGQPASGLPPFWHVHDFSKDPIFKLEHEFNFLELLEEGKDTLSVGLCIESRATARSCDEASWMPGCGEQDQMPMWMGTVDDAGAWALDGFALPVMTVWAPCALVQAYFPTEDPAACGVAPDLTAWSGSASNRELSPGREFE